MGRQNAQACKCVVSKEVSGDQGTGLVRLRYVAASLGAMEVQPIVSSKGPPSPPSKQMPW